MKTEKKSSEATCVTTPVVKEEPDVDSVKIKEESGSAANTCNNENTPREESTECQRESNLDSNHPEGNMSQDNQNGSNNQSIIGSVKQENEQNHPGDDLQGDCAANVGLSSDGIQPLVSNVLGKQMGTGTGGGEAQYMQQQSQIFVFSTMLANKGADAVLQGQFPSIIAYHCAQPGTKKFLEKHPSKVNQFRQNPAQWLNNLAMMKQKGQQGGPNSAFPTEQPPDLPALEPNAPPFWNEQSNIRNLNGSNSMGNPESSIDDTNIDVPCLVPNSPNNSGNSQPPTSTAMGHSPSLLGAPTSPGSGLQPSLQGVKVPDENLTPQQRLHREEQLATIRKMQMLLFPERKEEGAGSGTLDPAQGAAQTAGQGANVSCAPSAGPPVDWHKLQQHFFDGKNKVGVGSPNAVASRAAGVGQTPRGQGPPPPYHQTTRSASVPIAIQSPNPSSPNNPTSNLSLPSPRASSALNSPADCNRQFQIGSQRPGHLPGQSPTSQDSPNPGAGQNSAPLGPRLNHSNPGTPVSHSHLAALSPNGVQPQKDTIDFTSSQPNTTVDGMFCRTLQSLAQQKQQHGGAANASGVKEANLMPVPSPQQIQYLNTFEGQELTIQKQPNTSLKDTSLPTSTSNTSNDVQSRMLPVNMENNSQFPARSEGASPSMDSVGRGFSGPLHSPHTPHTPGTGAPHTPADPMKSGNKTTTTTTSAQNSPAPHNSNLTDSMGPPRTVPASPNTKVDASPPSGKEQQQQQQMSVGNAPNSGNNGPPLGPGFPCSRPSVNVNQPADNVPLNPNNIGGRLGGLGGMSSNHFDPITSLAQMSQQLTNTAASNALGGGPEGGMHSGGPGMMPFNPHGMQHMMQMGEMNGCHMQGPGNEPGDVGGLCMGLGGPPSSYSPTPHTGSPGVNNKMGNPMMSHPMMHPGGYPNDAHGPPRLMGHGPGPSPYNGANVQVKPSAPNTIQYLPARPNVGHAPRGPPSLDFLQRFTNPLSNLESKMQTPSVNLQYFPNGCVPNNMGPHSGMSNVMGGLPGMGGPPRMDAQPMNNSGNIHPSMRPVGGMRPQPNIMRMQHMVGGGVFPGGMMDPDKVFPPEMVAQVPNQPNPGMYVPGSKGSPMGLGPPDASQPLPPSMGGASSNFKSSPFVGGGPSMSDPNYAQQFHNFQQQLYATGTRGSGPPHPNLHPPPNSHSHQQFFMPK